MAGCMNNLERESCTENYGVPVLKVPPDQNGPPTIGGTPGAGLFCSIGSICSNRRDIQEVCGYLAAGQVTDSLCSPDMVRVRMGQD